MSDLTAANLLDELLRTTVALAATALVVWCLLRLARSASPAIHRAAWIVVLLQGWLFVRWGLNVPWYEPPSPLPRPAAWDFAVAASMPPGDLPGAGTMDQPRAPRVEPTEGWHWRRIVVAGWLLGMIVAVGRWLTSYGRLSAAPAARGVARVAGRGQDGGPASRVGALRARRRLEIARGAATGAAAMVQPVRLVGRVELRRGG